MRRNLTFLLNGFNGATGADILEVAARRDMDMDEVVSLSAQRARTPAGQPPGRRSDEEIRTS
jgi:hypothetical protein